MTNTLLQKHLRHQAALADLGRWGTAEMNNIVAEIKTLRGTEAPACWHKADCTLEVMKHCPWRVDC
jgi:hypothetical protein